MMKVTDYTGALLYWQASAIRTACCNSTFLLLFSLMSIKEVDPPGLLYQYVPNKYGFGQSNYSITFTRTVAVIGFQDNW
jgi:hypothetical protein